MITLVEKRSCPSCGAPLKIKESSDIIFCEHCGSSINLKAENEEEIAKLYMNCYVRFNNAKNKTDFLNVMPCLKRLGDYKDSKKLYNLCLARVGELSKRERIKKILKIFIPILTVLIVFAICTCIFWR